MHLKRVFPDSLTLEMDPEPTIADRLWDLSRLCVRLWNAVAERRMQGDAISRADIMAELRNSDPEFSQLAPSVTSRLLWSMDEAYEQYVQAKRDLAAGKRVGLPAAPGHQDYNRFFPLHFTQDHLRLNTEHNILELGFGNEWIPLQLPKGDFHKIEAVLIMYHPDRKHFEVEINPILQDMTGTESEQPAVG